MMTRRQWLRCGVGESKRWYPSGRDPDPRGCAPALPNYSVTAAWPAGSTMVTLPYRWEHPSLSQPPWPSAGVRM
jgi:hypothetical protein